MRALITGITGQDGSLLAEYLLQLGYEVHGIVRRSLDCEASLALTALENLAAGPKLHVVDLCDSTTLDQVIREIKPDECYHLAAESKVSDSFLKDYPILEVNIRITYNLLLCVRNHCPACKVYFAGSSEMFGAPKTFPQSESTEFFPRSLYGVSKVAGFHLVQNFRAKYEMFCCVGILFNHESPRRREAFVTRKITMAAAQIRCGLRNELRLGNLEAKRDWGFAGDYVKAMHRMLALEVADDYVIGTGRLHSVREVAEIAFSELSLDYQEYVIDEPSLHRQSDSVPLVADTTKAQNKLGWRPTIDFHELIRMMAIEDFKVVSISEKTPDF